MLKSANEMLKSPNEMLKSHKEMRCRLVLLNLIKTKHCFYKMKRLMKKEKGIRCKMGRACYIEKTYDSGMADYTAGMSAYEDNLSELNANQAKLNAQNRY